MSFSVLQRLYSAGDALLAKSTRLIGGKTSADSILPVNVDSAGNLLVAQDTSSPSADSAGKLRVSEARSLYEIKHTEDIAPLIAVNEFTGGGTAVHVPAEASVDLNVFNTGDKVYRRSRIWIPYQPGRSQQVLTTGVFGTGVAGIRRRIGYFDATDGLYFEQFGPLATDYSVNILSSTAYGSKTVARADWDDPLDGTGPSGANIPLHEGVIFTVDFLWLGMDRVRFLVKYKGVIYTAHLFKHDNLVGPYMARGSLPVAYSIENVSAGAVSASLRMVCSAVFSEGGFDPVGLAATARNITGQNISGAGASAPLLSVRLKAGYNKSILVPRSYGVVGEDNKVTLLELVIGGTLTGASFTSLTDAAEVDTAATAVTGGRRVRSLLTSGGSSGSSTLEFRNLPGVDELGNTDIISLVATRLQAGGALYYGSFDFDEVL